MHMIREATKFDCAVKPQDGGSEIVGEYFRMDTFAKAKFTGIVRGQLTGATCTMGVYQATDATGSGAVILDAVVTFTQGVRVTLAQIAVDGGNSTINDTITLTPYYFNGEGTPTAGTALVYTAKGAESLPNRQFDQSGTADEEATSIAACVNDATYGVPGMLASVSTDTVVFSCTEPGGGDRQVVCEKNGTGSFDITESNTSAHVVTDLIQMADFEVYVQDLDRDNDFTHVGARFAAIESATYTVATLERAMAGYGPVGQAVIATRTSA